MPQLGFHRALLVTPIVATNGSGSSICLCATKSKFPSPCNLPSISICQIHTTCTAIQVTSEWIQITQLVMKTPVFVRRIPEILIYWNFGILNHTHRQATPILSHPDIVQHKHGKESTPQTNAATTLSSEKRAVLIAPTIPRNGVAS